ncbi:MAG: hypothetical protein QOD33_1099 [Pyrinomonadaceae bacterium]|jgi:predicted nucleotidyltransferase|nr:hypothetical protein [Pyrinomonadaceae bacterium]
MDIQTNWPRGHLVERYAEVSRYFMGQGSLNIALAKLTRDLKEHGIDYMVIGALALFEYGYARLTEDIDLVMTPEGLEVFHRDLIGLGYLPAFQGGKKRLRSTTEGITIEIMITGEYPGDGKPKPVSIPDPAAASIEIEGVRFVNFEKLIELKLASGMTAPHRLKDLADVQELIKIRALERDFAERLDPYVREKFLELYEAVAQSKE